jgi:alanyl-tRNA synthetase
MNAAELRRCFINFFVRHHHEPVKSSSLIPAQDPTLLFTNAGMNQFKDLFLGKEKRSYSRAVSVQKCVRAGGKHNDLDNVGFTKRHLTFFEMLGNFSFGDYFKKEAIEYAWEFLTQEIKLDSTYLHVTVHHTDDEAYALWHTVIGLPADKIHRLGDADNFWQMGDVGPCGPCTEIHIDRGASYGCSVVANCGPTCDCDRFLEIWNLVFMQYDRLVDGSLKELVHKGVDTGMGLERLCAIVQNKESVFATDQFVTLMLKVEALSGITYKTAAAPIQAAFHVLADHIRSSCFLIADGCAPSHEGRGYVLRKIIRRAALFAQRLGSYTLFPALAETLIEQMEPVYSELRTHKKLIQSVLDNEVERFAHNLERGMVLIEQLFRKDAEQKIITGDQAFKLYDTYGFPIELITATAREWDFAVDIKRYEQLMQEQKMQSGKKFVDLLDTLEFDPPLHTEFTGYTELETESEIIGLVYAGASVSEVLPGLSCFVIMRKSPFFIVGGGQVPDHGWLTIAGVEVPLLHVRYIQDSIAAEIQAPVELRIGMKIRATVDRLRRTNAMKNHTATHLLQAALMHLFGNQVKQSGSLVHPDYLRFDFTYHAAIAPDDIVTVEKMVNAIICDNIPVTIEYATLQEATRTGVIAFFGDKYNPDKVRIVRVGTFSAELCGGTHVSRTGDIGIFKIIEISSPAAGHRRIVAVTGPKALEYYQLLYGLTKQLSHTFSVRPEEIVTMILKQKDELRTAQKKIGVLQKTIWQTQIPHWRSRMVQCGSVPVLCLLLKEFLPDDIREIIQTLSSGRSGGYFVGSSIDGHMSFAIRISSEYRLLLDTKRLATWLQEHYDLKGGGKPGELQGSGPVVGTSFEHAWYQWVREQQGIK